MSRGVLQAVRQAAAAPRGAHPADGASQDEGDRDQPERGLPGQGAEQRVLHQSEQKGTTEADPLGRLQDPVDHKQSQPERA